MPDDIPVKVNVLFFSFLMYVDFNYRDNKNFVSHRTLLRKLVSALFLLFAVLIWSDSELGDVVEFVIIKPQN